MEGVGFVVGVGSFLKRNTRQSRTNGNWNRSGNVASMTISIPQVTEEATRESTEKKQKVRIGIIGAGRIGQVHAENIRNKIKSAELAGISSGSKHLADACGAEHSCSVYYDHHDLLQDEDVDAVCICSASNKHTEQIIEAAEAGKHIFCEKPIDTDLAKIDSALAAVKKAGVKLQVGFNRRFDRNYARVKQAVVSREIGDVHMIKIFSRDPSPPTIEYVKSSGGIWLDCTIHDFDMARHLVNSEVEEVYSLGSAKIDKEIEKYGDVDTSVVMLRFKNGVLGSLDNSRKAVFGYDQRCEVFGSKGAVAIDNNFANSAVVSNGERIERDTPLHFFMDRYAESFVTEMKEFVDCVLHDKPVPVTGLDGRAPVVIALAAKKSFYEKRPVKLSEIDGSFA